jgi:L-malate glycosyltransferase
MHIVELCLSPDLGGLELYAWRSAQAIAAAGDRVTPWINPDGKLRDTFAATGLACHYLRPHWRKLPLLAARHLAAWMDREAVDTLHLHWGKDLPLAALAKALSQRKPRLVYTRQMMITRPKRDPYHNFLYDRLDCLITITEQLNQRSRQMLRAADSAKIVTLYYGVAAPAAAMSDEERQQLRQEWQIPPAAIVVGLFGRLEPSKGQHLLIDALAALRSQGITPHSLIVGHEMKSGYREQLRQQATAHAIGDQIHFAGFTQTAQRWMQACDIILLASAEETFGLVLAEAMRAGVAVIGSDRGGVPEIIRHNETGLLFTSGEVASLADQLRRLISDSALRQRLAAAGKADADLRFNDQRHFAALGHLLRGSTP